MPEFPPLPESALSKSLAVLDTVPGLAGVSNALQGALDSISVLRLADARIVASTALNEAIENAQLFTCAARLAAERAEIDAALKPLSTMVERLRNSLTIHAEPSWITDAIGARFDFPMVGLPRGDLATVRMLDALDFETPSEHDGIGDEGGADVIPASGEVARYATLERAQGAIVEGIREMPELLVVLLTRAKRENPDGPDSTFTYVTESITTVATVAALLVGVWQLILVQK